MQPVSILGKGMLAIRIADWFLQSNDYYLHSVVPVIPEPTWSNSLKHWARGHEVDIVEDHNTLPDGIFVMSVFYEKILKKDFLDRCSKAINLHSAPLPKYRGVRPINWALKNNENHHGVTIHEITPGIDDGPILGQVTYPIYPEIEGVKDVYIKSLDYAFLLFQDVISKIDKIKPVEQNHEDAIYYSNGDADYLGDRSGW
jgi:methionyl-tRNA formyltransferase